MDLSSLTKNPTNSERSEIPSSTPDLVLNDEVDRGGASLADPVGPETPPSPQFLSSSSVSPSLADIFVPEKVLADPVVPETPPSPQFRASKADYEAFEKEYEERIGWHSKNKFMLGKKALSKGSNSSYSYSYEILSISHFVDSCSKERDDDTQ